jgi:hypothetical protein
MRPIAVLLVVAVVGCGEGEVRLETDHSSYVQEAEGPAPVAIVSVANGRSDPITIPMCDLPGLDYDAAPMTLQRRAEDGSWSSVAGTGFCPTSEGVYGVTVEGMEESYAGRVSVGAESGHYRFVLEYEVDDGIYDLAHSNMFTTTVPIE